jgi:hypothetical protein
MVPFLFYDADFAEQQTGVLTELVSIATHLRAVNRELNFFSSFFAAWRREAASLRIRRI